MILLEVSPASWPLHSLGPGADRAGRDWTLQSFPFYGRRDPVPNNNWATWAGIGFFSYLLNYFCEKSDKGIKIRSL